MSATTADATKPKARSSRRLSAPEDDHKTSWFARIVLASSAWPGRSPRSAC